MQVNSSLLTNANVALSLLSSSSANLGELSLTRLAEYSNNNKSLANQIKSTTTASDTVVLSPDAIASLLGQANVPNSSSSGTTAATTASTYNSNYQSDLVNAFDAVEPLGTTTFTFSATTGDQVVQPGTAAPSQISTDTENGFTKTYAEHLADGAENRFYKGSDPAFITASLSDAEKSSFITAYNSHSLDIQSAADATGVKWTGNITTTFSEGATGGSESIGGNATFDVTALKETNQYSLIVYDPFFGASVVSWGGPETTS